MSDSGDENDHVDLIEAEKWFDKILMKIWHKHCRPVSVSSRSRRLYMDEKNGF